MLKAALIDLASGSGQKDNNMTKAKRWRS